jgi:hypothetical protein
MKHLTIILALSMTCGVLFGQLDKTQLSLAVAQAEAANMKQLASYVWKRHSTATVKGEKKATVVTEFSFDATGKLQSTVIDAESAGKDMRGIRGHIQDNKKEEAAEYVEKALQIALSYSFMSKGELVDFFDKAAVTESDGFIKAVASNVLVPKDTLTVLIDPKTNLFVHKQFSSFVGEDPIKGELGYAPFSNGVMHGTETSLQLPAKGIVISGINQDYTQRVN